ncbi:hypothetical protein Q6A51_08345 [Pseudomonas sp. KFB-139]|uniref:Uncharacterized protein n=1 Tax=Pseudomonas serbiensis TaxID=3064350 RepID=A0ABT9CSN0_9PSED|nr:hypothetical protein [Pseudomonas sp. KFB-138]MDO7926782.1 hypothetical protein [Pseudomonas sp. KFB-138]
MQITNSPLPVLTPGGTRPSTPLPASPTPPPPLTDEQKAALEKLRDQLQNPTNPPVTATPEKTTLIDEVV